MPYSPMQRFLAVTIESGYSVTSVESGVAVEKMRGGTLGSEHRSVLQRGFRQRQSRELFRVLPSDVQYR